METAEVQSTKGAAYPKYLVMSCNGTDVKSKAYTLAEATQKLADLVDSDACFVMKIVRTTSPEAVKVFESQITPTPLPPGDVIETPVVEIDT